MRQPHLLYLAWGFPPSRAGGVYRALATVNQFVRAGWRVTVLTADRDSYFRYTGADTSLEAEIPSGVRVVRVPFDWPARDTDVRHYSALRVALPRVWNRLRAWRDQLGFPEASYGPWRPALTTAAVDIHRGDPVDLTIATANPHVTFAAAYGLHRRAGIPFVMDYRDAWRLDVFSGRETRSRSTRVGRWERRMLTAAREVWFVNEPILRWHADRYPSVAKRMHLVANGWDPEFLVPGRREPVRSDGQRGLNFAYLGTITPKVPVAELLAGWRAAMADGRLPVGSTLTLAGHLGYFAVPQGDLAELVSTAAESGVHFVGPLPKAEVAAFYAKADVLVLALGSGRYVTSGKVYEYVATHLPIVAVYDQTNATRSVLAEHPFVAQVRDVTAEGVAEALAEGARLATSELEPAALRRLEELAESLRRDRQLAPRVLALTPEVES